MARWLYPGQRAFQIATQIALLTQAELIGGIIAGDDQLSDDARGVARIGLANYFAGALLLPYQRFLEAAESVRYDIGQLARRFGVGFETICHRLSTLQRPGARGVPFIFVRTDSAGNISKRPVRHGISLLRVGGNCPLWVVHHAFSRPGSVPDPGSSDAGRAHVLLGRADHHDGAQPLPRSGQELRHRARVRRGPRGETDLLRGRRPDRLRGDRPDRCRLQDLRPDAPVRNARSPTWVTRCTWIYFSTDLPYPPAITS